MKRSVFFTFCVSSCLFVAIASSAGAAPPAVTYLYPAGGQRGASVEVTATGTFDASAKVWASGKGVSVKVAKGKWKVTAAKDAVPGVYWLRAYNTEGASPLRPFFVGTLPEVTEKEPNDEPRKPQVLEGSCVVNGKLSKSGDVDCFAIRVKKGQTLVASLEANRTLRAPMDAMLQVLSADGFVLEENNDFHGLDPQIAFTAKQDGTYLARVYAFPSTPDASIRYFGSEACLYRLTLTTGAFADFALAATLDAKEVGAEGWNFTPGLRKLTLAPGLPGDPFVTAYGRDVANVLRVRREPHPVHGLDAKGPLKPPFSATGRIAQPGSEATFTIDAKKGRPLTLQVESRSLGLAVNPVVRVLDGEKKQLARAEPGKLNTDTTLAFNPPADGKYTVAVSDLFTGGGPRHGFLLRVLSEPDYELTVAADRFALTPGKPALIAVKVNRIRGFKSDVEVTAEGLPEGVKAEVTKPGKPDPNTVTLSLTAEKEVSGPFRIVGKVKGDEKMTRVAHFTMPDYGEETADLWLAPTAADAPPKKKKK